MTTNKPEVKRFNMLTYQGAIQSKGAMCVLASDYDALQAECEKLRDRHQRLVELGEDSQWENIIRVDISEFPSRAEAIDAALKESRQ